jgi:hypothetical protein
MQFLFGFIGGIEHVSTVIQDLGLDLQEIGLNGGGAADAPEQGRKPEYELALNGCSGIVIRDDGRFKCSVVSNIFQSDNDGFGRQSMSDCVLPRPPFAIGGFGTGAPERIASIGLDLSKRSHPLASPSASLETGLPTSARGSMLALA